MLLRILCRNETRLARGACRECRTRNDENLRVRNILLIHILRGDLKICHAVAIGTAHGNYKEQPVLRIDRLKEIAAAVKTPLVLHGGTGLTDEDFKECIASGIQKINIATASYDASANRIRKVAAENPTARYFEFSEAIAEGTYENVKKHMAIFGMKDKA